MQEDIPLGDRVLKKGQLCLVAFDLLHALDESLWDGDILAEV